MKLVITILTVLIGLLSLAAGAAKVALTPQEVEFLSQFGLTNALIIAFGITQVLGGVLLLIPRTRFYGALLAAVAFAISAVLLLVAGNLAFAAISLLPVLLAGFVGYRSHAARPKTGSG